MYSYSDKFVNEIFSTIYRKEGKVMYEKSKQEENNEEFADGYAEGRSGNIIKDVATGFRDNSSQFEEGYKSGKEDRCNHGWKPHDECGTGETESKDSKCFLTTACIRVAGLTDNCYELTTLRSFRDNFVAKMVRGPAVLAEYYEIAPVIVQKIKQDANRDIVLSDVFATVKKAVELIECGNHIEAFDHYEAMFVDLKRRFHC